MQLYNMLYKYLQLKKKKNLQLNANSISDIHVILRPTSVKCSLKYFTSP